MATKLPRLHYKTGVTAKEAPGVLEGLKESLEAMLSQEVLVGFPEDGDAREDSKEPTNAQLAYIHDQGAPEANIPQREFMRPGIESVQTEITDLLGKTAAKALRGGSADDVETGLTQVGFKAANGIKRTINEGIPPPLSDATLRQRMRSGRKNGAGARKGAARELDRRWDGEAPSTEYAKPLVDTAQMRNAVTFVIRKKGK